tara:strand:- start:230 stop:4045 length:3816 start_codon:yes stop_codon:yes gene_type:complete
MEGKLYVPKNSKSIKDFSGGVAKGVDSLVLKDNQMKECVNFIADSVGKLVVIPSENLASTNEVDTSLPDGYKKNIHSWSADMNLSSSTQNTNMAVPTATEKAQSKRANMELYFTPFQSPIPTSDTVVDWSERNLIIKDADRDEYIINTLVNNPFSGTIVSSSSSGYDQFEAKIPKNSIQGLTLNALEKMAHKHYLPSSNQASDYTDPTIPWHFKTLAGGDTRLNGSDTVKASFGPVDANGVHGFTANSSQAVNMNGPFHGDWLDATKTFESNTTVYTDDPNDNARGKNFNYIDEDSGTKVYPLGQRNGGAFKVESVPNGGTANSSSNTIEFGVTPFNASASQNDAYAYKMIIEWDYYGKININFPVENTTGAINYAHGKGYGLVGGSNIADPKRTIDGTEYTYFQLAPSSDGHSFMSQPTDANNYLTQHSGAFTYVMNDAPSFGQFSEWEYKLTNISRSETATYGVTITYYTNVEQSSFTSYTRNYTTLIGQSAVDVRTGLFYDADGIIDGIPSDHQIKFELIDDKVRIFQDSDTVKAYGIKEVTVTKTDIVDLGNNISSGARYQHLVAITNQDSMGTVYSMENDTWIEWQLDLKFTPTEWIGTVNADNARTNATYASMSTGSHPSLVGKNVRGSGISPGTTITAQDSSASPATITLSKQTTSALSDVKLYYWDHSTNVDISYMDAEGSLFASDVTFNSGNRPQWFGYLDLNHTYLKTQFDSVNNNYNSNSPQVEMALGFNTDALCPSPYRVKLTNNPTTALKGQDTHIATQVDGLFKFKDSSGTDLSGDETLIKSAPNSSSTWASHPLGIKIQYDWIDGQGGEAGTLMEGSFLKKELTEFYFSYLYEGGFVSQPQQFYKHTYNAGNSGADSTNVPFSTAPKADSCALGIHVGIGPQLISGKGNNASWTGLSEKDGVLNTRLKGVEIYARFTNTDPNNIYLICEIDLNKGWKSFATGKWKDLTTHGNVSHYGTSYTSSTGGPITDHIIYKAVPTFQSFYHKYQLAWDEPVGFESDGTGWKTACVFNRRAYYGNVRIKGKDNQLRYYPDGILKSALGMYASVGVSNLIEATINDGDDIVALRVAGNKLCQFKKYSLTIMGIKMLENGENREEIEETIHHVGLENDNQICDTPYGLFWVSRSGIYLYNGQEFKTLSTNQEGSLINKTQWESFYGKRTHVGYDAYWNQVHICKDMISNNETLIYSFNTGAFTEAVGLYGGTRKTGFVTDREGHLMWAEDVGQGTQGTAVTPSQSNKVTELASQIQTAPPPPAGD